MSDSEPAAETPCPEDAFAALGNETRVRILRVLGDHDDPLSFSDLYDELDVRDSGQFNYHLEKLVGHFVHKTDDGYTLARAGRRVVEAILSGAVTGDPSLDPTVVDEGCDVCGAPMEVSYSHGAVELFCTECDGKYSQQNRPGNSGGIASEGYLGRLHLPPAGLRDRDADAALGAAWTRTNLEIKSLASGLCPRCSGTVTAEPLVCSDHDATDGICEACGGRYAVGVSFECTNCILDTGGAAVLALLSNTDLLDFLTDHDRNPVDPDSIQLVNEAQMEYEEDVRSRDPLEATFTFAIDGDTLALSVDDELRVVEATRG